VFLFPVVDGGPPAGVQALDVSAFGGGDVIESVFVGAGQGP
jgi:hypothetical protein